MAWEPTHGGATRGRTTWVEDKQTHTTLHDTIFKVLETQLTLLLFVPKLPAMSFDASELRRRRRLRAIKWDISRRVRARLAAATPAFVEEDHRQYPRPHTFHALAWSRTRLTPERASSTFPTRKRTGPLHRTPYFSSC